jgi:hypothetical protein
MGSCLSFFLKRMLIFFRLFNPDRRSFGITGSPLGKWIAQSIKYYVSIHYIEDMLNTTTDSK